MTKGYLSPRAGGAAYKQQVACEVARNTLGLKSELIRQLGKLEAVRNTRATKQLSTIIGKLEAFQVQHGYS